MTTVTRKPRSSSRATPAPAPLTPEQIEARAAREVRITAYEAARDDLVGRALALAEKLCPGRVHAYRSTGDGFAVMFGESPELLFTFRGPGLVELQVELGMWERVEGTDDFAPVSLRFTPRAFSMGRGSTRRGAAMEHCEAVGRALIDAAAFARTLLALTSEK